MNTWYVRGMIWLVVCSLSAATTVPAQDEPAGTRRGGARGEGSSRFVRGNPLFFDDYDYVVTADVAQGEANRLAFWKAGYSRIKALNVDSAAQGNQSSQTGGGGRLYTVHVSEIPGHTGRAPGSTQRALCINSLAGTTGRQTDFYFRIGSKLGDIPANVYFQFWVYVCHSGDQQTQFHAREKFIYPTRNTYPASPRNNGCHWLFELTTSSYNPDDKRVPNPGEVYALSADSTIPSSMPVWDNAHAKANGITGRLGQTDFRTPLWVPNQWIETRIHYDTSGPNGVYEVWTRRPGEPWVKRTEWIGGTTVAGSKFTWTIDPQFRDGHAMISVPTTMPGSGNAGAQYDAWIYLQDFAMARSASDLPRYDRE